MANTYETLSSSAKELYLHATSNSSVNRAYMLPAFLNIQKRYKKGTFIYDLGLKLLQQYTLVSVAKDYHREHGSIGQPWHKLFSVADRQAAAEVVLDGLIAEFKLGNFYS